MYSEKELCNQITSLYPDIGECGIDIDVSYNDQEKTWVVQLEKDAHSLIHFLEIMEADKCMEGKQCVSLGLEIAQLLKNIQGRQF